MVIQLTNTLRLRRRLKDEGISKISSVSLESSSANQVKQDDLAKQALNILDASRAGLTTEYSDW
ncbi:hypothetical protein [Neptuniibacter sp. QD37_11]|uniref:hypothetical protein n=1 Tax=Neptuniibacter sp. QD37_11 TaxID=3398209 RepID=UPI0039F55854